MSEPDNNNHINNEINLACPEISVNINNLKTTVLIDTGANASCIAEQWFKENREQLKPFEELPVNNTIIRTAIGEPSKRLKRIIFIPITIEGQTINVQLLVVPHLLKPVIFGVDLIAQLRMEINFDHNIIKMCIHNINIVLKFGVVTNEGYLCNITVSDCQRLNNDNCNFMYNDYNSIVPLCNNHMIQHDVNCNNNYLSYEMILNSLNNNDYIDITQKEDLTKLLNKYQNVFSDQPGLCNKYTHELKVTNPQEFKCINYPVPLMHQDAVMKEINRMEKLRIIERSKSTFINPIIPVVKKTGEIRLCLDARRANAIIVSDFECNRSVNEILTKCKNAKYISSIDLTASYWQIPLSEESRQYTAFQFRGKTYQYRVTPFGISTSQAALVRAFDKVFDSKVEDFTAIYIDDICVISPDFHTHVTHLEHIFQKLKAANMTINFIKSHFCQDSVPFLGYTLTNEGLMMDKSKVEPILNFPPPKSRTQLKAFLGCINYYNKFIDKFSTTVQPLMRLTSKKVKFKWTTTEEEVFYEVKQLFLKTNTLNHPDTSKEFYLQTDASEFAIGGHLYQFKDNGEKAAIIFFSRILQPAEQRFTTTEKELLSIIYCLQKARYIVLGAKLTIITDNHALTFLKTCRLLNNRLARWILLIQEYNFTIIHCKGVENVTADTLSRIKMNNPLNPNNNLTEITVHYIDRIPDPQLQHDLRNLSQLQQNDIKLQPIIEVLKNPPDLPEHLQLSENYKYHNNILYQKLQNRWLIVVPDVMVRRLIWECHMYYLHCGPKKCFQLLQEHFIFKNMNRTIRKYVISCDTCQRCKINTRPLVGVAKGVKCLSKNQQIAVDVIGPLPTSVGNVKYLLIVIDIFTKFLKLYPMRRATTKIILNKLFNLHFPVYGLPKKIQSDNGTQFKSKEWITKFETINVQLVYSPVYYPCYNLAERPIREIKRCLRTYCSNQHKKWVKYIPDINRCLNELYHESTGFTPNELQFDKKDVRFWEKYITNHLVTDTPYEYKLLLAARRIENKRNKRANKFNQTHKTQTLNINDKVLIKTHPLSKAIDGETAKLFEVYEGPYIIKMILGDATYHVSKLNNEELYGPYHISTLRKYIEPIDPRDYNNVEEEQDDV